MSRDIFARLQKHGAVEGIDLRQVRPSLECVAQGGARVAVDSAQADQERARGGPPRTHADCRGDVYTLFLLRISYHFHVGSVHFRRHGAWRPIYFTLLTSHTILAAAIVPMVGPFARDVCSGSMDQWQAGRKPSSVSSSLRFKRLASTRLLRHSTPYCREETFLPCIPHRLTTLGRLKVPATPTISFIQRC